MEETSVESQSDVEEVAGDAGDIELGVISESQRSTCAICLDAFNEGDAVSSSNNPNCKHHFHQSCMENWLMKHEECPCCRRPYLFETVDL